MVSFFTLLSKIDFSFWFSISADLITIVAVLGLLSSYRQYKEQLEFRKKDSLNLLYGIKKDLEMGKSCLQSTIDKYKQLAHKGINLKAEYLKSLNSQIRYFPSIHYEAAIHKNEFYRLFEISTIHQLTAFYSTIKSYAAFAGEVLNGTISDRLSDQELDRLISSAILQIEATNEDAGKLHTILETVYNKKNG